MLRRRPPSLRNPQPVPSSKSFICAFLLVGTAALGGCARDELSVDNIGVGQRITRSLCPAVAIPTATGDVTLFDPPASREARAIDVVATISDVRATCDGDGIDPTLVSNVTFRVGAVRQRAQGSREVIVPYFATVLRGGSSVVSKQVGQVTLRFADGQARAQQEVVAQASIQRAAATLPEDIRTQITRKRKATDADASIDPMADPRVRKAMADAAFEFLVGFQLSNDQLRYNATR